MPTSRKSLWGAADLLKQESAKLPKEFEDKITVLLLNHSSQNAVHTGCRLRSVDVCAVSAYPAKHKLGRNLWEKRTSLRYPQATKFLTSAFSFTHGTFHLEMGLIL